MGDDAYDLELATAGILADNRDAGSLLAALVTQLRQPLGERLQVQHRGRLLRKSDAIRSLRLSVGDEDFEADLDGGRVACRIGHSSGGIRIRSETVEMDQWLRRLLAAMQQEAEHSQATRLALENIMSGGRP